MLVKKRLVSLCLVYFFGSLFLEPLGLSEFIPYCLSAFLGLACLAYCCESEVSEENFESFLDCPINRKRFIEFAEKLKESSK